jgi:hypothetical protein
MRRVKEYKGTFSSNNTPKLENNQAVVINFSKYGDEGSHFISIYMYKNKCLYFDPLCIKNSFIPIEIKKYMKKYKTVLNISKKIQNNLSEFCGFFCILFIISLAISKKYLYSILSQFEKDGIGNDKLCIKLLKRAINEYFKNRKNR